MIENKQRELTLLYNSSKMDDKKARAFVESLNGYTIKSLDLAREKITPTQLAEVADKMEGTVNDLYDESYASAAPGKIKGRKDISTLEESELLKMLVSNTELIATPLIILGDHAYRYASAYDLVKKDLDQQGGKSSKANAEETDMKDR